MRNKLSNIINADIEYNGNSDCGREECHNYQTGSCCECTSLDSREDWDGFQLLFGGGAVRFGYEARA